MEPCKLGTTKRGCKRLEWIRQKSQVADDIHRIKSLKWKLAGHKGGKQKTDGPIKQRCGTQESSRDSENIQSFKF